MKQPIKSKINQKIEQNTINKLKQQLFLRFGDKVDLMKKTKFILDEPKSGFITKQYPIPDAGTKLPYVPAERELKKYMRYVPSKKKYETSKSYTKNTKKKPYLFNNSNLI